MSSPLISFTLPAHPAKVLHSTFLNESFFHDFLTIKLHNKDIYQSAWQELPVLSIAQYERDLSPKSSIPESFQWLFPDKNSKVVRSTRDVASSHPVTASQSYLKLLMGFLPSYSESIKYQTLLSPTGVPYENEQTQDDMSKYFVLEKASFRGLPFADIFEINTIWRFQKSSSQMKNNKDPYRCSSYPVKCDDDDRVAQTDVDIFIHFDFKKSCWVKELIKSGTKSELKDVLRMWCDYATDTLNRLTPPPNRVHDRKPDENITHNKAKTRDNILIEITVKRKTEKSQSWRSWLKMSSWKSHDRSE